MAYTPNPVPQDVNQIPAFLNFELQQIANPNAAITSGTINGTTIGEKTPSSGSFTTITASSNITQPNRLICCGTLGAYVSLTTPLALSFDINNGSMGSSTTNRITAPVAGKYFVHMRQLCAVAASTSTYLAIYKNGTLVKHAYTNNSAWLTDLQATHIIDMAVNDYITFAYLNGAPSTTWAGAHSEFTMYYLG